MLNEERFKISAFVDPAKPRKDAVERLVTFNTMYIEQYANIHPELHEDAKNVKVFLARLGKISGSSITYGASAEYGGDRAKLEEAAGEKPIGLSVVEMLNASDVNIMDYCTDKLIKMVQEGHLGEYTDMTVKELLAGNAVTIVYDNEIWTSYTSEAGAKVVEVLYPSKDEFFEDIKIQFTMLNDECFKVTAYEDADYPVEKVTDLTAQLNYFYLSAYIQNHQEIVGTDDETKFIKSLEKVDGFLVQYGASADYKGDRRKICEIAGDLPTEGTVVELLDSSGLFDMSFYYPSPTPVPTPEPTPEPDLEPVYSGYEKYYGYYEYSAAYIYLDRGLDDDSFYVHVHFEPTAPWSRMHANVVPDGESYFTFYSDGIADSESIVADKDMIAGAVSLEEVGGNCLRMVLYKDQYDENPYIIDLIP